MIIVESGENAISYTGGTLVVTILCENTTASTSVSASYPLMFDSVTKVSSSQLGNDLSVVFSIVVNQNSGAYRDGIIDFQCVDISGNTWHNYYFVHQGTGFFDYAPIWSDTYYTAANIDVFNYIISYNGTPIYSGKGYCAPGAGGPKVKVNEIAANFLRNDLSDTDVWIPADEAIIGENSVGVFSICDEYGAELMNWVFLKDHTDEWTGQTGYNMSTPINGHLDVRMKVFNTEYNNAETVESYNIITPYDINFSCSPTSFNIMSGGGSGSISVSCDNTWTAVPSGNWISVNPSSGASGSYTVNVTIDANPSSTTRSGSVDFKHSGFNLGSVSISQAATENNKIYYTTTNNQKITIGQSYTGSTYWRANMTGNTYTDGVGCLSFDGDVQTVPTGGFSGMTTLQTITLPNTIWGIGQTGFKGCTALTEVSMPTSLTTLGSQAFSGCTSLKSITIPSGCTTPGDSSFVRCSSLSSVTISEGVKRIGTSMFSYCTSLSSVTIPSSVTGISDYAFSQTSLSSVTITSRLGYGVLDYIGQGAFAYTNLVDVHIPECRAIGTEAFINCTQLTSMTIEASAITMMDRVFSGCTRLERIYATSATAGSITNTTFYGIRSYGTRNLFYPTGADYSSWLSNSSYYLGYYGWTGIPV